MATHARKKKDDEKPRSLKRETPLTLERPTFSKSIISLICSIAVLDDSFKLSTISCTNCGTFGNTASSCPKMSPAMAMVFSGPRTSWAMCRTMARFASKAAALVEAFCSAIFTCSSEYCSVKSTASMDCKYKVATHARGRGGR